MCKRSKAGMCSVYSRKENEASVVKVEECDHDGMEKQARARSGGAPSHGKFRFHCKYNQMTLKGFKQEGGIIGVTSLTEFPQPDL